MASFTPCTILKSWGSHKLQELTKNLPITKTVYVLSNTKSNKLSRLHLTLTKLALALAHLLLTKWMISSSLDHFLALDLQFIAQFHSLFFSWVASVIQCIKDSSNEPGGALI